MPRCARGRKNAALRAGEVELVAVSGGGLGRLRELSGREALHLPAGRQAASQEFFGPGSGRRSNASLGVRLRLHGTVYYPGCRLGWLAALVLLAGGCLASRPVIPSAAGPGWQVREGQALWRPNRHRPELAGELVMASHGEATCSLEFSKAPFPLVRAQTTRTNWFIQFPAQHISLRGGGAPPARFAWLHLHAALAGQSLPPALRFERKPEGGWRLVNTRSGESLEGFLAP